MKDLHDFLDWLRISPPGTQFEATALLAMLTPLANVGARAGRSATTEADPTIQQVATELGRSPSTVRGWRLAGEFPNAYQLRGREWRIPRADLAAFIERQKPTPCEPISLPSRRKAEPDLAGWRQHFPKAS